MDDDVNALVAEQVAYYRARAPDYDDAYLGKQWDQCIDNLPIAGDVLELACGSGHWTPMLAVRARSVTAVDAAPEMLALARRRVGDLPVEFIEANLFDWQPPHRYDTVFFAFWLTHVPPALFAGFWSMVGAALAPGGWVCLLDSSNHERGANTSSPTSRRPPSGAGLATAASTAWSRSTTRRPSLPPGLPSWAGRQASVRPAPRSLSVPPVGDGVQRAKGIEPSLRAWEAPSACPGRADLTARRAHGPTGLLGSPP